jgi:hypothetical protein
MLGAGNLQLWRTILGTDMKVKKIQVPLTNLHSIVAIVLPVCGLA